MSYQSKGESRKQIKQLLKSFSEETKQKKSLGVSKNISKFLDEVLPKEFPNYSSSLIIGGFAPMIDEINWMLDLDDSARLAFPSTNELGEMIFLQSRYEDLVETNEFGVVIKSPASDSREVIPDLLFVPGLAFGRTGERLGRGKGYYDKFLEKYNGLKIGICTSDQLLKEIPTEPHDIKMDVVIVEDQIILIA
ncbi:MAG: 5-formyltetrahydrofolate cyclo-ligase [Bacteriovoracaceae bacterium]|jgi:5-formyltetrahydrofolate cyclo-ligase